MAKLNTLSNKTPQHVIVYGPPKSGKTQLLGNLSKEFKLIWFDLEGGIDTLLKLPESYQANIDVIRIRDNTDDPRAHKTIDKIINGGTFDICDEHGIVNCSACKRDNKSFSTVTIPTEITDESMKTILVIDSGSQLTMSINTTVNMLMNRTMTTERIPDRAKNWGDEWDAQGKYLNRILSKVQMAPFHVAITAHELLATREDESVRIVPSIGTTNYAINCSKFFGHVIYMDKINLKHKAFSMTNYSNKIITGSRLDISVESMPEADLADIFNCKPGAVAPANTQSNKVSANVLLSQLKNGV